MYFANSTLWGKLCVSNCESVGMYSDGRSMKCVGCHPTCEPEQCFGPSNTECYDCAPGFVRYDKYTCDTECMPENSFIRGEEECVGKSIMIFKSIACHDSCRKCFGTSNNECEACYDPYYLDQTTCRFNATLAALNYDRYRKV
jgi:hypothetical protein